MANPNILSDLKPVKDRTAESWRYKTVQTEWGDVPYDNHRMSDNDDHKTCIPMSPTVRRR